MINEKVKRSPLYYVLVVSLLSVVFSSMPFELILNNFTLSTKDVVFISGIIKRTLGIVVVFLMSIKFGFTKAYRWNLKIKNILPIIPAFIVVINNFPFIGLINGARIIENGRTVTLYVFYTLTVALFEEITFREIVFPLFSVYFEKRKNRLFLSVVFSSAVFALLHVLNLFSGQNFSITALQVGYTFLLGAMFSICLYLSCSIFFPVLMHFIFNFGGEILDKNTGIMQGKQWDNITVIITAVIGVLAFLFYLFVCLKNKGEKLEGLIYNEEM